MNRTIPRYLALILFLAVISPVFGATKDVAFDQLIARRERLNSRRVSVVGYFDAERLILVGSAGSLLDPAAIDLSPAQIQVFKKKGLLRSRYVRVVGKFEYVGAPKVIGPPGNDPGRRIPTLIPTGFRGVYSQQITNISEFTPQMMPFSH